MGLAANKSPFDDPSVSYGTGTDPSPFTNASAFVLPAGATIHSASYRLRSASAEVTGANLSILRQSPSSAAWIETFRENGVTASTVARNSHGTITLASPVTLTETTAILPAIQPTGTITADTVIAAGITVLYSMKTTS